MRNTQSNTILTPKKVYRYQLRGYWNLGYVFYDNGKRLTRCILEHRNVYEDYHKCRLLPWSHIHHINGQRADNRIENLEGMTISQHMRLERTRIPMLKQTKRKISETQKVRMTPEIKRRLSLQMIGEKHRLGQHHSEESKRKLSEALKGRIVSEDTRRKLSEAGKRWWSRLKRIKRNCFVCGASNYYVDNKGAEQWNVRVIKSKEDKYLCELCYKKQYYLQHRATVLSKRRKQRDKNRKDPFFPRPKRV